MHMTWLESRIPLLLSRPLRAVGRIPASRATEKRLYLTYDDGPSPELSLELLDALSQYRAQATFFVIGTNVERHPAIVERMVAEGHAIGNHTHRHLRRFSVLGPKALAEEVDRAQEAIHRATGFSPVLLRPPVGHKNPFLSRILSQRRMRCVAWTHRSGDTWGVRGSQFVRHLARRARPGSILLLHDRICGQDGRVNAIPELIEQLSSRGFRFVTLPGTH